MLTPKQTEAHYSPCTKSTLRTMLTIILASSSNKLFFAVLPVNEPQRSTFFLIFFQGTRFVLEQSLIPPIFCAQFLS